MFDASNVFLQGDASEAQAVVARLPDAASAGLRRQAAVEEPALLPPGGAVAELLVNHSVL